MRLGRRAPRDPETARVREAFGVLAERLDAAQRGLLAVVPTYRDPGLPLAQGLAELERGLSDVGELMPTWRTERTGELWEVCRRALDEASGEAERLRLETAELSFEALQGRVHDVIAPLEAFADAEREIRAL